MYYVWLSTRFDFMTIRHALSDAKTLPITCFETLSATIFNKTFSGRPSRSRCEVSLKFQVLTPSGVADGLV
jgi:hypothetical protein